MNTNGSNPNRLLVITIEKSLNMKIIDSLFLAVSVLDISLDINRIIFIFADRDRDILVQNSKGIIRMPRVAENQFQSVLKIRIEADGSKMENRFVIIFKILVCFLRLRD